MSLSLTAWASPSLAQEDDGFDEPMGEDSMDEEGGVDLDEGESELAPEGDESGAQGEAELGDEEELGEEEAKPKGNVQLLLGVRYRAMVVPKGLINLFGVDGGRTLFRNGVGGEIGGYFGKTADGFMVLGSVWWMGYGLDPTPFKGKNDDDSAWEVIESNLGALYITLDAMWDHKIMDRLSFNVGAGFGVGVVTGKLYRTEAYVNNVNPEIPADKDWPNLSYCRDAVGNVGPNPGLGAQCPFDGNYGEADRWPVYPWINFQLGLRYQPIDQFVGRFDMGIGSSGIWFGLGADYSLFL